MLTHARRNVVTAIAALAAVVVLVAGGALAPAVAAADITLTGRVLVDGAPATAGVATLTVERWHEAAWQSYPGSALTDADGEYSIAGVEEGSYRIRATATDPVSYPDAVSALRTVSGSGSSWNMSDIYLVRTYPVSGHVNLAPAGSSAGVGEVDVRFSHPGCCEVTTATTDAQGDFALRLPKGSYSVRYQAADSAYAHHDTTLVIAPGVDPEPLPAVTLQLWPKVSGHVENVAGDELAGIDVTLDRYTSEGAHVGTVSTTTDSHGDYEVAVFAPAALYSVYFSDPSGLYATVAWDDRNPYDAPDVIEAGVGVVDGVDAVLPLGGVVQGKVSGPGLTASRLPYVVIEVYVLDDETAQWIGTGDLYHPDSTGAYRIPVLYPDDYRLGVSYDWPTAASNLASPILDVGAGQVRTWNAELPATLTFSDVPTAHPFFAEIEWMFTSGVSTGYLAPDESRTYRPSQAVSREAMAAFLFRYGGNGDFVAPTTPSFSDVPAAHPFYREIEWMLASGISTGWETTDGRREFRPAAFVSREAMSAFLHRAAGGVPFVPLAISPFTDVSAGMTPFVYEISWMKGTGIALGYPDGSFHPRDSIARDAMAAFLYRFSQLD